MRGKRMKILCSSIAIFLLFLMSAMNGNVRNATPHGDGDAEPCNANVVNGSMNVANAGDEKIDVIVSGKDTDILLVDDDQDPSWAWDDDSEQYYMWALNDSGYPYDYWDVNASGLVPLYLLNNYTIVIWFTADARNMTLLSNDQTNISSYLDGGGKLFISGEDIGYDLYEKNESAGERVFYENYLHAAYHRDSSFIPHLKGAECDPIGNGSWIDIVADSLGSHHPDVITPIDKNTTTIFGYTGNDTGYEKDAGAIRTDNGIYKVVYFSFRFELIEDNVSRNQTMARIIEWLNLSGDTIPPKIEHVPLTNTSDTSGCAITAMIEDNTGVNTSALKVYYSVDRGKTYHELSMASTGNQSEYEAEIPGQPLGTTIYYYIQANDTNGNTARSPAIAPMVTYYTGIMEDIDVLIVNDDQYWVTADPYVTVVTYKYIEALEELGINWTLWKTYYNGAPSASLLSSYDVVIWFVVKSDETSNGPLTEQSIQNLKTYLDNGGHLFMSGDIESPLSDYPIGREFYEQYLHVRDVHNSHSMSNDFRTRVGIPSDPIGDGFYLSTLSTEHLLQGDGVGWQSSPDMFYPLDYDPYVTKVFRHTSSYGGIGGTRARNGTYSDVYIGFPFSKVNNPPDRKVLMFRTLMWLMHGNEPIITHYSLFDAENTTSSYRVDAENTTSSYRVDAEILAPCNDLDATSLKVYYSTGGPFTALPMSSLGDNRYYADIPSQSIGTTIYYYIEANTTGGNTTRYPLNAEQTNLSTCCSFHVRELADIILVDDDCGPEGNNNIMYEHWYKEALGDAGYAYEYWDKVIYGLPEGSELGQYNVTIWFTGDGDFYARKNALTEVERQAISDYLDVGGHLFLSGQHIGSYLMYDTASTPESRNWFNNTLHANYLYFDADTNFVDGVVGDPISNGFNTLKIKDNFESTSNNGWPDVIGPRDGNATTVFTYLGGNYPGKVGGIKIDTGSHKIIYFAFGFGGINSSSNRSIVMDRVIQWLEREGPTIVHQPLTDTENTTGPYKVVAKIFGENLDPTTFKVHYSINGAAYQVLNMTSTGNSDEYCAYIPRQPSGTNIYYYIVANDTVGNTETHPDGAPLATHHFKITIVVLIVNDEAYSGDPEYNEQPYEDALDVLGYGHDLWVVRSQGTPSSSYLNNYSMVIWFISSGFTHSNGPLSLGSQTALTTYLDGGGKLFIVGRVASFAGDGTEFYDDYLHADKIGYATTDYIHGVAGDPIGDGLSMLYEEGGHQIEPDNSGLATEIFEMDDDSCCGLKINSTYKAVYISYTYGWLNDEGDRTTVMDRVLSWLSGLQDAEKPLISDVQAIPPVQEVNGWMNITCIVTDNVGVSTVKVNVTYPDDSHANETMMNIQGTDGYYYNATYSMLGTYNYFIWATDTSGNENISTIYTFQIQTGEIQHTFTFHQGWNLITIPVENNFTAKSLIENISGCQIVCGWDSIDQEYKCFTIHSPDSYDFPIENGMGYFIGVTEDSNFSVTGRPISNVSIDLHIDWNLIGWFNETSTTAKSLLENITSCQIVCRWGSIAQEYKCFTIHSPPSYDFPIEIGTGLFVGVTQESQWHGEG